MHRAAASTSASLVSAPKLKRIAECRTSSATPIARSTGDGNNDPLEHADPVEQAIPTRSRLIKSASARQPGKDRLTVWGNPPSSGPFSTTGADVARSVVRRLDRSLAT